MELSSYGPRKAAVTGIIKIKSVEHLPVAFRGGP
jgi:hypothetical protein